MQALIKRLGTRATLKLFQDADHSFHVPVRAGSQTRCPLFALALAVGLTPELLPMVVTVTLANGARRLAARRVIVKRLAAIHDLGAMDVLCTDKTGTLTESEIKLAAHVDQAGEDSNEVLRLASSTARSKAASRVHSMMPFFRVRSLMPVLGISSTRFPSISSAAAFRFYFSTMAPTRLLVVKGAPEEILARSVTYLGTDQGQQMPSMTLLRERLLKRFETWGEEGYRVLGVASRVLQGDAISPTATRTS